MVEYRSRDRKAAGSSPVGAAGEFSFLQGQLSVLTVISVSVSIPCVTVKARTNIPVIVPKVQVARYAKHTCSLHMWLRVK